MDCSALANSRQESMIVNEILDSSVQKEAILNHEVRSQQQIHLNREDDSFIKADEMMDPICD